MPTAATRVTAHATKPREDRARHMYTLRRANAKIKNKKFRVASFQALLGRTASANALVLRARATGQPPQARRPQRARPGARRPGPGRCLKPRAVAQHARSTAGRKETIEHNLEHCNATSNKTILLPVGAEMRSCRRRRAGADPACLSFPSRPPRGLTSRSGASNETQASRMKQWLELSEHIQCSRAQRVCMFAVCTGRL